MTLTQIPGVRVGHWTDAEAATGCTVVLLPADTVASGEVRGGAPATRETALLEPHRLVAHIDAVVLTGGSAFGLAAADGVVRYCEEQGVGFVTGAGPVPIVVAFSLFDLLEGDPDVRPDADEGYAACLAATSGPVAAGRVGAGAGCTVAKWRGREHARPAGLGAGMARHGDVIVAALFAVNAFGDVIDEPATPGIQERVARIASSPWGEGAPGENTTVGVVVTNAGLDKLGCYLAAQSGHDGLARALSPAHTRYDGDAIVVAATGGVEAGVDEVRELAAAAVEEAVRAGAAPGGAGPAPE